MKEILNQLDQDLEKAYQAMVKKGFTSIYAQGRIIAQVISYYPSPEALDQAIKIITATLDKINRRPR